MAKQKTKRKSLTFRIITTIISVIVAIVLLIIGKVGIYDNMNDPKSITFKNIISSISSKIDGRPEVITLPDGVVKQTRTPGATNKKIADGTVELAGNGNPADRGKANFTAREINVAKGKKNGYIAYSELDEYGRTQQVTAVITYKMVHDNSSSVKKRPAFPATTVPSGWNLGGKFNGKSWVGGKPNNRIVHANGLNGYFYNKSHLLAYSLGGDMNTHNVITGTRQQNVGINNQGGMAYLETKVRNLINKNHSVTVFYRATPKYALTELVPRSIIVQAYSLDDNGTSLNESVRVPNKQNDFKIDYRTGVFREKTADDEEWE